MNINPTIEFLTQRAAAVHAILTDNDKDNTLSVRQTIALIVEYNQLRAAMDALYDDRFGSKPVASTPQGVIVQEYSLWDWFCQQHRLDPEHDALTIAKLPSTTA